MIFTYVVARHRCIMSIISNSNKQNAKLELRSVESLVNEIFCRSSSKWGNMGQKYITTV